MKRFPLVLFNLALVFWVATIRFSAAAETKASDAVSTHAEASKSVFTLGEIIEVKLTIKYKKEIEILSGLRDPEVQGLEIKKSEDWKDKEGAYQILGKTIRLTGYHLGEFVVDPFQISYRIKAGPVQTLQSNPVYLTIKSVAAGEEKKDIRDVKGVVPLPYEWLKYTWPVGSFLVLALLIYLYSLHRKRSAQSSRPTQIFTPEELAVRELHELFDSSLIRDGQVKQYYLRFSEIIKTFMERQFGIQAVEATTSEIVFILKRLELADDTKKRLIDTLESADFAKFAKWVPAPVEIISLNKQAEALIHELAQPSRPGESHAVS